MGRVQVPAQGKRYRRAVRGEHSIRGLQGMNYKKGEGGGGALQAGYIGFQQHEGIPSDLVLSLHQGVCGLLICQFCVSTALTQLALHCLQLDIQRFDFRPLLRKPGF